MDPHLTSREGLFSSSQKCCQQRTFFNHQILQEIPQLERDLTQGHALCGLHRTAEGLFGCYRVGWSLLGLHALSSSAWSCLGPSCSQLLLSKTFHSKHSTQQTQSQSLLIRELSLQGNLNTKLTNSNAFGGLTRNKKDIEKVGGKWVLWKRTLCLSFQICFTINEPTGVEAWHSSEDPIWGA